MAQYPPPPQPEHHHYNPLYPTNGSTQQLLDHQDQLSYNALNQPIFPKGDSNVSDEGSDGLPIHRLAQEIEHQAALEEQQRQHLRQAAQQIQEPVHSSNPDSAHLAHQQTLPSSTDQSQKANRLRKACDSCSLRKVKCDEAGPPCRACKALQIPCTFDRPSKRRGPPNKHADAVKRRLLENPGDQPFLSNLNSAPSSPTHAAQALAELSSHAGGAPPLSAESICPIDTLGLLIDDFFTYVYPLCPFPHEPSFREAWKRREDLNNRRFLALLASMTAAISALFPRKARLHLKYSVRGGISTDSLSLTNRCIKICSVARGPGYLESENINVYDAATSHFLGLASEVTSKSLQARLYYGECTTILESLRFLRGRTSQLSDIDNSLDTSESHEHELDNITTEINRRIFWTMYAKAKAGQQTWGAMAGLGFPSSTSRPYPAQPAEVDDFCIYPSRTEEQPPGLLSRITGLNATTRIYRSCDEVSSSSHAVDDTHKRKRRLRGCIEKCKSSIEALPAELAITGISASRDANGALLDGDSSSIPVPQALLSAAAPLDQLNMDQSPERRRQIQNEVQKTNIYASYLGTRAYLLREYKNLEDARKNPSTKESQNGSLEASAGAVDGRNGGDQDAAIEEESESASAEFISSESESLARDLLVMLTNIDAANMEGNALSIISKLRLTATILLSTVPNHLRGLLVSKSQHHFNSLLDILSRLERQHNSPVSLNPNDIAQQQHLAEDGDEDPSLKVWGDLRELQRVIAQESS